MLESLDLDLQLEKSEYKKLLPKLRDELAELQRAARSARVPVLVVLEGWDASGKGDSIGHLVYPLDPRGFKVFTTAAPTAEERLRPFLGRFWLRLPAAGDFALFDRSWYRRLLEDRVDDDPGPAQVARANAEIREFEHQLTAEGFVLIKLWLHISRKEQKRRLRRIEADPYERWRATQKEWRRRPGYKKYASAAEEMFEATSTANAPWTLVEATDSFYRRVKVFRTVIGAIRAALAAAGARGKTAARQEAAKTPTSPRAAPKERVVQERKRGRSSVLDRVDLTKKLDRAAYEKRLDPLQERLRDLGLACYRERLPVVIVYEGWDAAGKGGNIKRLTQELDPRGYDVIPISAPDATEAAHHYLWRFWRQLPKAGHLAIFDRSWYGRVLVERVEDFASESAWQRAYDEINDFERQLAEFGAVVIKFWLHLSAEEQLRRFEAREKSPWKRHKLGAEDWRNRARWNDYRDAVAEMLERTGTTYAPWTVVEADDKLWARIRTLAVTVKALEKRLRKA